MKGDIMASRSSPFPSLKTTGDDKHDMEVYIEDLVDYCVMHNWYDPAKESAEEKWTKPDKAMACLRASLSPAARTIYKYSLGLTEEDQKKPHLVLAALTEFNVASIGEFRLRAHERPVNRWLSIRNASRQTDRQRPQASRCFTNRGQLERSGRSCEML